MDDASLERDEGIRLGSDGLPRCWWPGGDELYRRYHDEEWGRPVADDRRLFEKICLEGFQSGLSWITILRKRENFRRAFAGFDAEAIVRFDDEDVARLLADPGIVRHRGKIEAVLTNARRFLDLRDREGSFAAFVWRHEPDAARRPARLTKAAVCELSKSRESEALSKELRRRGWAFVGPTTCYAFMQSMGVVNDHLDGCALRPVVEAERAAFVRPG
ncbi:MAG: DNA-3-methyladenine glycosylase I [Hyphomicrobiales bacterium]|nr:DNA-3-methyladenine glycosylase I [Hyphomicrobiales bacterium]